MEYNYKYVIQVVKSIASIFCKMIFQNNSSVHQQIRQPEEERHQQHIDQSLSLSQQVIQDAQGREEEAQRRIRELEGQNRSLQEQVSSVDTSTVCVDGYCCFHTLTASSRGTAPLGGEEGGGGDDHRGAGQGSLGSGESGQV